MSGKINVIFGFLKFLYLLFVLFACASFFHQEKSNSGTVNFVNLAVYVEVFTFSTVYSKMYFQTEQDDFVIFPRLLGCKENRMKDF